MELLEGRTLLEVLDAHGRLELGELGWLSGQLGRALEAAHRQGIVHRDLKPSNVFIAEDDEGQPTIKLCDFGIAKLIDPAGEGSLETNTGALLGTPMYLAPEEPLRGAADAVPATDQWALGLLAYRALAGTEYFSRARGLPGLVLAIANDPMVPPSALAPSLPAAFDDWFLRSCARDPAARFPDVPAQVSALAAALGQPAPRPIPPRVAGTPAQVARESQSRWPPRLPRSSRPLANPTGARASPGPSGSAGPPAGSAARPGDSGCLGRRRSRRRDVDRGRLRTTEVHAATAPVPRALPPSLPPRAGTGRAFDPRDRVGAPRDAAGADPGERPSSSGKRSAHIAVTPSRVRPDRGRHPRGCAQQRFKTAQAVPPTPAAPPIRAPRRARGPG